MQIAAGASAGRPAGAGRRARGDPATSGALAAFRVGAGRGEGRGKPRPGPAAAPASASQAAAATARPLFRGGVGEAGLGPRAFRPQPRRPAAHRWLSARDGRPRHFYVTMELCAPGMRLPAAAAPVRPHLHPASSPPAQLRGAWDERSSPA
jgi:hypothetical protein